jgi:hypothetical protein
MGWTDRGRNLVLALKDDAAAPCPQADSSMNFLHSELVVPEGHLVQVALAGQAANVLLLDDANHGRYVREEDVHAAAGGYYTESPVMLRPPWAGRWHLVVDLGGAPGEVRASVVLRPDERARPRARYEG